MSSPKNSVHLSSPDAYNLWSSSYDQLDNPMLAMVDHALAKFPLEVDCLRVVELGCGTGRNVERVLQAGARSYFGFDQSEGMLREARGKHPSAFFEIADIQKRIPLVDGSVDFVLVTLVLEHLQTLEATLREAFRVLAPGGVMRVFEIHSEISSRGTQAHFQNGEQEIQLPSYTHDENEWRSALAAAGFSRVEIRNWSADPEAIARCAKLAKHEGRAVLFEAVAQKD